MPLKIDIYTIVRNEFFMMPYFLRHYETFANRIFVWDDNSDDGTLDILKSHPKVILLPLPKKGTDDDFARHELWPQYMDLSRDNADWVMQVDVDEFVYHPNILNRLSEIDGDVVFPTGYLMISENLPSTDGQIYDEVNMGVRDLTMDKPVIFRPHVYLIFRGGRHRIETLDTHAKKYHRSKIKYLHFRYFGMDYYYERIERNCYAHSISGSLYSKTIFPFNGKRLLRMPDRSMGVFHEWWQKNSHKLERVVP